MHHIGYIILQKKYIVNPRKKKGALFASAPFIILADADLDAECGFFGAKPYFHTASFPEKVRYAPKMRRKISP